MWKRLISLSLTFGLAAAAPPVSAQSVCARHEAISAQLTTVYRESVLGRGLQSANSLFEIWRSTDNGTWTILMLRPDGVACIMASGFAWIEETPDRPEVEGIHLPGGVADFANLATLSHQPAPAAR